MYAMLEVFIVFSVLLGIVQCQGQDLTTQPGTKGSAVVSACIARVRQSGIFTSDNEMLRRIAFVETDYGNAEDTYRSGYDGGIWAVDENIFNETKNTASYSTLTSLHNSIQANFSIQWSSVEWNDLRKPLYSALAARLYFYTVSASIPISSSIQSQATYWVTYYNTAGNTTNFVTLVNELLAMDDCSVSGIDIYFVLDESGSVGSSNYQLMKQFVYNTVDEFDIGPDDTQVGVISYSSSARARFYLNSYHDKTSLLSAINNLPFTSGGTNTAGAIDLLRVYGYTSTNGGRPHSQAIPRVAVVITDGYSNSFTATVAAAELAHDDDITIFSVGIGSNVNSAELDAIASDPSYVSTITGFDTTQFAALQTAITNEACTTSAPIEINETVITSVGEGETTYIEIPFDSDEGVTIKLNVTNGTITLYASDQTTTPNEAFYDWMIETDGYSDVYLDPDDVNRTIGDTVYIAIEGDELDNDFTLVPEDGDTRTAFEAPTNVTIGVVTTTMVNISWSVPTNIDPIDIIRFDIEITEEQLGLSTIEVSTTNTSVIVTGLEEYNTYMCRVAAVSNSQVGTFSTAVNFTTLEAAPTAAPQSPTGSELSPSTIRLEWDPPPAVDINGEIEYYVVEVEEVYTGRMWTFHAVDVHINIASLHAFYVYKCRIAAFTIAQGPFTSYYDVYSGEMAPTAAPENVTVVDESPSSVNLTWDAPPYEMQNGRIRNYNIEITEVETGSVLEFTANYTNTTISGLVPFYNYTCTVSAETVAVGPSSDEITFVLPEGPPDGAPQNVSGEAINSTSIEVTWDPPARSLQNGYITEYRVVITETETGTLFRWTVIDTSLIVESLHPYYVYEVSVSAVTVGIGPYSTPIYVTTDEDVPTGVPQNITASATSPFEANISWSPPLDDQQNGIISNYIINVTEDATGEMFQESSSNTSHTIDSNLRPYYTYTFEIAAETSVGLGPFSSGISITTHEYVPSEPSIMVSRRDDEPNELLVSWTTPEEPNGIILNYTVYCDESSSFESGSGDDDVLLMPGDTEFLNTTTVTVSGSEQSAVVMNLIPYTYYDCYVTASTSVGEGNSSTFKSAQTDESEPGDAPTNFGSRVINSTAVRLTWDKPLLPYGVLLSYTITYNISEGNASREVNSSDPRELVIADLEEHTWYKFEIVASTRVGSGPFVSLITRTDISAPHSPPTSISFEVDSSTKVTLSWEPPPFQDRNGPIIYYTVFLYELVFGLSDVSINVTSLSYTLTGLEEYNNYSFIIAAATGEGTGPYSTPINFTTEEDRPSSPPSAVTGDVQSATLVIFSWQPPPAIDENGVITYYVVKIRELVTNIVWTFFAVDEDINIGSLHPYYYYNCTVSARTSAGTGPYSTSITVQTEEAAPSGPPLSLTSRKTSTSLTLYWDPPSNESQNGIVRQYVIRIIEDETSTTTTFMTTSTWLRVNDLHPYYTYKCSVAAETVGVGPFTTVLTVQLDEDSPSAAPVNLMGMSLSSTSINLSWSPPPVENQNGIIRSYTVNSVELETNDTFTYTSLGTTLQINSLHPYYQYQITVTAVTISSGPSSDSITVQTDEDAPSSPVQNNSVGIITSTTITLSWEAPADDQTNGIILLYIIRVVPVGGGVTLYYNSSVPSVTLTSLRPYTVYECYIAAETSAGRGPFSNALTVETDEAAPSGPPQNLTGTSVSSQAITLTWSEPLSSEANGVIREYIVNVTEVETGTVFSQITTSTTLTLQSLHPYYNYECIVSAFTVGLGPFTAVFNIRTPEDVPTGYPQSFVASSTSSRSAILTWNPPRSEDRNGIVTVYTINVSAVETGENFQLTSIATSITVTSLRPYTTYRCIIAASTSVGIGPFSTVFTLVTPEDVPTSAPTDTSGRALSSNSIYLSWDLPPPLERHGIIREYHINLTEQETGTLVTYTSSSTFIEISLLHPYYTYLWIVTAVTIGEGPYTATSNVTTLQDVPSGPPLNISSTKVYSRNFTLAWNLPEFSERNGEITGYNISITSLDSLFEEPQEFFTTDLFLTVDNLDPHTEYICIIAANTYIGIGPFSLEYTVQTDEDVPGSPSNTTGMALNSTHVNLTWDPPHADEINGIIQGYRINITELNTGEESQYIAVDTEAVIGPLHPHYDYNFSIAAFTSIGHGPTTFVVVRTAEAAPSSSPEVFMAGALNPTSISLSWSPPPLEDQNGIIRHYEVTLVAIETGEIHIRTSVSLTITITSLRPYTTYNCTVAAETVATGPVTMGMLVLTLQAAPSAPPEEIQVSAEDSRTLQLTWQPPEDRSINGIIQRYYINITELNTYATFFYVLNATELSLVVDNLHPYYSYSCVIAAETVDLGPFSTAVIIELPEDAPSSSPVDVSITSITSTSFYMSWNDPPLADQNGLIRQYLISIYELNTGNVYTHSSLTNGFNAMFLHPYYYYNCSVSAVTVASGPFSYFVSIQTAIDVPSGPPESIDTVVLSSTSLLLSWTPPSLDQQNGPIVGYSVRLVRVDSDNTTTFFGVTASTVLQVDSLVPYTTYEWSVAAQTDAGTGPFSSAAIVQTLQDAPDDAPQQLTTTNIESTLIELSWMPPPADAHNGEIIYYLITYIEIQTGTNMTVTSFETEISLGNLHPYYDYIITIAAFTVEVGPSSLPITVQTLEDVPSSPPTDLLAVALSARELNITWVPPAPAQQNGIIRNYLLTVSILETGTSQQLTSFEPQILLENLHPYYTYLFLIAAVTIGPGPFSGILSIQMPPAAPVSPPQNVSIDIASSESISVTWNPPPAEDQNGIITLYTIKIYSVETGETKFYIREAHHSQFVLETLHPHYEYDVSIAAETVEIGPFSTPQRIQMLEDLPSAAPQNLTVTVVNSRTFVLYWVPPPPETQNGVIRQYQLSVSVRETRETYLLFLEGTQFVFDVAHPFYTYTFTIAAETIGTGPYGEEVTITAPEDVPTGPPQLVEAESVSSSSIRITWTAPLEEEQNGIIRSYYINVTEVPTGIVRESIAFGDERIEIVNMLHPYYVYECSVAAYTIGLGPAAFAQTRTNPSVPSDVPLNLEAFAVNATHAHLSWSPPLPEHRNGLIEIYHIAVTETDTDEELQYISMYNSTFIGPLHPYYTYKFSVAAVTVDVGPFTSQVTLQMPEAAPTGISTGLSVEILSPSSVRVSWVPPDVQFWNGIVTGYTIIYENRGSLLEQNQDGSGLMPFMSQTISIPQLGQQLVNSRDPQLVSPPLRRESVLIEDLEEYYLYSFTVYQENTIGEGPWSEPIDQEMPEAVPEGSPTNVLIDVKSSSSVNLRWEPPELADRNGIIINYHINVTYSSNNTDKGAVVPANAFSLPIEGIAAYSIVTVKVAAATSVGIGPFSQQVSTRTEQDVPSAIDKSKTTLEVLNETAVKLSWQTPDPPNGIILEYQIVYYGYKPIEEEKRQSDKVEILDGPKVINIPAEEDMNFVYEIIIDDLVAGLTYDIKLRARTEVGYGPNITLNSIQPSPTEPVQSPEPSAITEGGIAAIILGILALIGWIIIVALLVYFVRRHYKKKTYKVKELTTSSSSEVAMFQNTNTDSQLGNSNPVFELEIDDRTSRSMTERDEDSDIDEKPPLDLDEPENQTTHM